jgi:HD-GYP domain-containing protein (c-di-GMP phosphodiesterase class II)
MNMNILIHTHVADLTKLIGFQLESQLPVTSHTCFQFGDVLNILLGDQNIDLIIISPGPEVHKLVKLISTSAVSCPIIFVNDTTEDLTILYPEIQAMAVINTFEVENKLVSVIRENLIDLRESPEILDDEYCRVHTSLLLKVAPLTSNVFIKLSKTKFVKMFQAGAVFSREEYERYLVRRNIEFFYIKKNESQEFLTKLSSQMDDLIEKAGFGNEEALQSVAEIQDVVMQMSGKLGFSEDVQNLIKKNMQLTLKAIGNSKKLTKIISDSQLRGRNYLSQHSVMLASISCSLASQQDWVSDRTYEKLILASLLHDIHFQNPELAKIGTKSELDAFKGKISEEEQKLILSHPIRCSDLVKTMKEIPSDVDVVVLQHHESPDGKGFPKGLTATQISPLSAVLIVAHDIVDRLMVESSGFKLDEFLQSKKDLYTMGSFKKIAQALRTNNVIEDDDSKAA